VAVVLIAAPAAQREGVGPVAQLPKASPSRAIHERQQEAIALPDPVDTKAVIERYQLRRIDHKSPLPGYLRDTWNRRLFIHTYARAQVAASNNQSALGMWWVVLNPALNAFVYWFVFGIILGNASTIPNYIAYLVIGIFVIEWSTQVMGMGSIAISGNIGLVRALQFPKAVLPIATVHREALEHIVSMSVMIIIVVATGEFPSMTWLLLPLLIVMQYMFNLSLAFVFARIGSAVADFKNIVPFIARVWLFLSGVFFSVSDRAETLPGWLGFIMQVNPGHVFIELYRSAMLGAVDVSATMWYLGAFWAVVPLLFAVPFFWRGEQTYGKQ
jgi:teichoic acid transport system permease protein